MKKFIQDFKTFAVKWNVLDLAIAVVIGWAFWKIVSSLVADIITPIIWIILWWVSFIWLKFKYWESIIAYGNFLQTIFDFLIISLSIFIFINILNKATEKIKDKIKLEQFNVNKKKSEDILLLEEIRDLLKNKNNWKSKK